MQKKQVVIPGNLPSQLCVLDSPATPRSSVLSFLFKFPPYSFPPEPSEKLLRFFSSLLPFFTTSSVLSFLFKFPPYSFPPEPSEKLLSFFLLSSLFSPPPLSLYHAVTSNDLCSSHLSCTTPSAATFPSLSSAPPNGLWDPLPESSSTCQSPIAV